MAINHITLTPWRTQRPSRPGWYAASAERNPAMRSFYDGTTWSAQVDEAASYDDHDVARATPMDPARARTIEWCGLDRRSAHWLAAELAAEPAL
jgi:hypothetical protein